MSNRQQICIACVVLMLVAAGAFFLSRLSFYQLTGSFLPIRMVESLQSPVEVTHWSEGGLVLADGRSVQLPGFRRLPVQSAALSEITKRGVEISSDGRIYGLAQIHHWCGNDPVTEHIARVDIANVLTFLREGEMMKPPRVKSFDPDGDDRRFSEHGWDVGSYYSFCTMEEIMANRPASRGQGSRLRLGESERGDSDGAVREESSASGRNSQ